MINNHTIYIYLYGSFLLEGAMLCKDKPFKIILKSTELGIKQLHTSARELWLWDH